MLTIDVMPSVLLLSWVLVLAEQIVTADIVHLQHHIPQEHQQRLHKRGLLLEFERFKVINLAFPCNATAPTGSKETIKLDLRDDGGEEVLLEVQRTELVNEDMKHFYRYKGGTFIEEYLANSPAEAQTNFPDPRTYRRSRGLLFQRSSEPFQEWKSPEMVHMNNTEKIVEEVNIAQLVGRRKRLADQTSSETVYLDEECSAAGAPYEEDSNYMHLCSMCAVKRQLPPDRYPTIINEVVCNTNTDGCLGGGNGKCVPTLFNVHLLKRKDGQCRVCIKNDNAYAVTDWELYVEPVSVGCECMVHKNSNYSKNFFKTGEGTQPGIGK